MTFNSRARRIYFVYDYVNRRACQIRELTTMNVGTTSQAPYNLTDFTPGMTGYTFAT